MPNPCLPPGDYAPSRLTLAVISDIHVHHDPAARAGESNYAAAMPEKSPTDNPFVGLRDLIVEHNIKADFVVCPGDVSDRAHPSAMADGWDQLETIRQALDAFAVLSSAGNHDVDSRHQYNLFDAAGYLRGLSPLFPVPDRTLANEYWAHHYCIVNGENYRIVLLNSAAYHGQAPPAEPASLASKPYVPEYVHGRVAESTIARLSEELLLRPPPPLNVLVCHHHPVRVDAIADKDYSTLEGAGELLQALSIRGIGRWLIIHGHRHVARIAVGPGRIESPVLFGAGSFGKNLHDFPLEGLRNQFYLVELEIEQLATLRLAVAGSFRSWAWVDTEGWVKRPAILDLPRQEIVLPTSGGFGYRGEPDEIRRAMTALLEASSEPYLTLDELATSDGRLRHVPPFTLRDIILDLADNDGVKIARTLDSEEIQLRL